MASTKLAELKEAGESVARETRRRNRLILQLRLDGYSWPKIAELAQLTVNGVERIAIRENKGKRPVPRQQEK
jgi:hypothetical protein